MPVHVSSTRAHRQEAKLYYTTRGIITPIGGRPVHRLREDLCTGKPPIGVCIKASRSAKTYN